MQKLNKIRLYYNLLCYLCVLPIWPFPSLHSGRLFRFCFVYKYRPRVVLCDLGQNAHSSRDNKLLVPLLVHYKKRFQIKVCINSL